MSLAVLGILFLVAVGCVIVYILGGVLFHMAISWWDEP